MRGVSVAGGGEPFDAAAATHAAPHASDTIEHPDELSAQLGELLPISTVSSCLIQARCSSPARCPT